MTNIKQRARELLTCDELRGRVPEEVQALLRDIVALEPVGCVYAFVIPAMMKDRDTEATLWRSDMADADDVFLYHLGANHE